jgi:hypothetical protein
VHKEMQEIEQMRAQEKLLDKAPSFDRFLNFDEVRINLI